MSLFSLCFFIVATLCSDLADTVKLTGPKILRDSESTTCCSKIHRH